MFFPFLSSILFCSPNDVPLRTASIVPLSFPACVPTRTWSLLVPSFLLFSLQAIRLFFLSLQDAFVLRFFPALLDTLYLARISFQFWSLIKCPDLPSRFFAHFFSFSPPGPMMPSLQSSFVFIPGDPLFLKTSVDLRFRTFFPRTLSILRFFS